jgi:putative transposase
MARIARVVIPGCPHHVIQRGNRRLKVFFSDADKALYLRLMIQQAGKHHISIWAYCLMDNHVHMVAVPVTKNDLARGIGEAHRKYTSLINIRESWKGYLWQGRFISYPLDETHLIAALRYVERNPVRAGLVQKAEEYPWSSAKAHVMKVENPILSDCPIFTWVHDWAAFLHQDDDSSDSKQFIEHELTGRPLGSEEFITRLEQMTGRILHPRRQGRKKWGNDIVSPV